MLMVMLTMMMVMMMTTVMSDVVVDDWSMKCDDNVGDGDGAWSDVALMVIMMTVSVML